MVQVDFLPEICLYLLCPFLFLTSCLGALSKLRASYAVHLMAVVKREGFLFYDVANIFLVIDAAVVIDDGGDARSFLCPLRFRPDLDNNDAVIAMRPLM